MTDTLFPSPRSAAGKAIALIIASGPRTTERLFVEVDFGAHGTKLKKLRDAILDGWLCETPAGAIDVTEASREHFSPKPKEQYIGQITPAQYRGNWRAGVLSKLNIPDRRGRRDVPGWSVKPDGYSIKTVTGGDA
jgi:hypothetical protein